MTRGGAFLIYHGRQFSKYDIIHVVPTWGGLFSLVLILCSMSLARGPQIMLPPSMGHWLAHMPEDVLNAKNCTFYNGIASSLTCHATLN